jgi:hypothetical protein
LKDLNYILYRFSTYNFDKKKKKLYKNIENFSIFNANIRKDALIPKTDALLL